MEKMDCFNSIKSKMYFNKYVPSATQQPTMNMLS